MRFIRAFLGSFRVRLVLAIGAVVAMALSIVLIALPRQLDSYFEQQDQANLKARTEAMATLVGNQIIMVTTLAGNPFPVLQEQPLRASDAVYRALEQTGFVKNLTPSVALADVTVTIAGSPDGTESVYTLGVPLGRRRGQARPDPRGRCRPRRCSRYRTCTTPRTRAAAPIRLVTVTLSRPFTFREQTVTTLVNVMVGAAVAALGASIVAAVLLAQWLTSPVRRLTHASRALAEGRLDVRVPVKSFGSPELAELAGSFNDMAERLQESIDIISADRDRSREFVADVSHELRTPIAALRTFNELLREGAADDPATRDEFLEQSHRQIERLDWLATNLLEMSKLDSGLVSLDLRPDDLRAVVESAVQQAEPVAGRKGIDLVMHLPERGDPAATRPASHRPGAHQPHRQCHQVHASRAVEWTWSCSRHADGARLMVTDTGAGIAPDEMPHVFDRFWRGARAPELRASGSGLGLSIVKSIVDMHEGTINILSAPDRARA